MIAVSIALIVFAWPVIDMLAEFDQRSQAAERAALYSAGADSDRLGLTALLTGARLIMHWKARSGERNVRRRSASPSAPLSRIRRDRIMLASFVYFILPVILLIIGFPIYLILLTTSLVAVLFVADVPLTTCRPACSAASTASRCWPFRSSSWPARSWGRAASPGA